MAVRKVNNIKTVIKNLQKGVENSLEQVGVAGVANIQSNTPVATGTLKRNWSFKKANSNKKYSITFGNPIDYSIYVEFKGKSQGFLRNTLADFKEETKAIIESHISRL